VGPDGLAQFRLLSEPVDALNDPVRVSRFDQPTAEEVSEHVIHLANAGRDNRSPTGQILVELEGAVVEVMPFAEEQAGVERPKPAWDVIMHNRGQEPYDVGNVARSVDETLPERARPNKTEHRAGYASPEPSCDIGQQLESVEWAKATYPADREAAVQAVCGQECNIRWSR
jgi:hypothetical protein